MDINDVSALQANTSSQIRDYQLEMYSESLKRNILVVMDTGSGKTLIAILRIQYELEQNTVGKIVWFMCPTVELADQQAGKLREHLSSSYQIKLLTGNDAVDTWRSQKVWEDALKNVSVVVCTYQILLDGLTHAFISISNISLLVFDEAHHCSRGHAANRIMQQFYHVTKKERPREDLPHIMGLSASPVVRREPKTLQELEQNLDALCKTPRINREELLKHVIRPVIMPVLYPASIPSTPKALLHVSACYEGMDIMQDPWIKHLQEIESPSLNKTLMKRDTICQKSMQGLLRMTSYINDELGSWAAQYYISACVKAFLLSYKDYAWLEGDNTEKLYLHSVLSTLQCDEPKLDGLLTPHGCSPKLLKLIHVLRQEMTPESISGIVFVKTRAEVHLLSVILAILPETKDVIRVSTFVGSSNNRLKRGKIGELLSAKHEASAVESLRSGKKNLIICTSVCEEGIDISACNLVICFEAPPNLKSFIQRRGRARAMASKFIIMQASDEKSAKRIADTQDLERRVEKEYMDEMRKLEELKKLESEDGGYRELTVASTGAKVTLQSSVQHLYHFCAKLPHTAYTTLAPIFTFEEQGIGNTKRLFCLVELPNCLDASLRRYESQEWWLSEKMARMDAAFVAYAGLRAAGLVNDNLLPMPQIDEEAEKAYADVMKRPSMMQVEGQLNPWCEVARLWAPPIRQLWVTMMQVESTTAEPYYMKLYLPCEVRAIPELRLYIDAGTTVIVTFDEAQITNASEPTMLRAIQATCLFLESIFSTRMDKQKLNFPALFEPADDEDCSAYFTKASEHYPATDLLETSSHAAAIGLITHRDGKRYIFHGIELLIPDQVEDEAVSSRPIPHLRCRLMAKRTDFFHPATGSPPSGAAFDYLLPDECTVSRMPLRYVDFARMIPSIMYHIGRTLAVQQLDKVPLNAVGFDSTHSLQVATTTSASRSGYDYQRLEFLGDTVLKMLTTINLMAQHPNWHEGYLAHQKDHIVSNGRLALAAQTVGLVKYIGTKQFTAHKWRPPPNEDLLEEANADIKKTRELSTKTLADVVEAIIGAAYTESTHGLEKAIRALQLFLPEVKWQPPTMLSDTLQALAAPAAPSCENYSQTPRIEALLNYTFINKALLVEAITHPSLTTSAVPSYQRLEFLGDAILDYIVTDLICNHPKKPSVPRMHRLRSATVNAGFLAYCALSASTDIPITNVTPSTLHDINGQPILTPTNTKYTLLSALRHAPIPALSAALNETRCRYNILQTLLPASLLIGDQYPWRLLAAFAPEKTVSDIVEALLGAVWIDCGGEWNVVTQVVKKLGLLTWLERALDEDVRCWHPKEEVGSFGLGGENGGVRYIVFRDRSSEWADEDVMQADGNDVTASSRSDMVVGPGANATTLFAGDEAENDPTTETAEIGKGTWHCRIIVNGESVCTASGWNRLEVETAAAEQAVGILKARKFAARAQREVLHGHEVLQGDPIVHDAGFDESTTDEAMDVPITSLRTRGTDESGQDGEREDEGDNIQTSALTQHESPSKCKRASSVVVEGFTSRMAQDELR